MGHYDDDYEYEEEKRRKGYNKDVRKIIKKLEEFRTELFIVPQRFKDNLDDLNNWLTCQLTKD